MQHPERATAPGWEPEAAASSTIGTSATAQRTALVNIDQRAAEDVAADQHAARALRHAQAANA